MIVRCTVPEAWGWNNYGAKGISVSDEWQDFSNFVRDMGERPNGTTIDRIDGNKGYELGNCRWASSRTQALNRKSVKTVLFDGKETSVYEVSRELNISYYRLLKAHQLGISPAAYLVSKFTSSKVAA
jgi:hypothetical protein